MGDVGRLESRLHSLHVMIWYVSLARRPVPSQSPSPTILTCERATLDSQAAAVLFRVPLCHTRCRPPDLVRKESVYRAYVAMCRAEGWPTRLPAPALGKMVKRAFPFVGTRRLGPRQVKHYYVGLCSRQLHHQPGAPADDADNATSDGGEWEHQCRCPVTTATSPCCLPVPPATSNPVHEQEPEEEPRAGRVLLLLGDGQRCRESLRGG